MSASTLLFIVAVALWVEAVRHYRRPVVRYDAWCRRPVGWPMLLGLGFVSIPWAAWRLIRGLIQFVARKYARMFPTGPVGRRMPIASRVVTECRVARVVFMNYRTLRRVWFYSTAELPHPASSIRDSRSAFDRLLRHQTEQP
jgi:hypothetical protein